MTTDLRFPIGRFELPAHITRQTISAAIDRIRQAPARLQEAIAGLNKDQLATPYRPEGWTVRQLIHHIPDSHLNSYVRFHWALTEDQPRIKAYDEKKWAELPYLKHVPVEESLSLLSSVHARWVILLENLGDAELHRTFIHPDDGQSYLLKDVILMYAWHGDHHIAHITTLRKRMGW